MPPDDWPELSRLTYYLFENEWLLGAMLLVAALFAVVIARMTGRRAALNTAVGCVVAAAVAVGVAWFVHTDREQVLDRTELLIERAMPPLEDREALAAMLTEDAVLVIPGYEDEPLGLRDLLETAERAGMRYTVEGRLITALDARADEGVGRSYAVLWVELERFGRPIRSTWSFRWRQGGEGTWRVEQVRWLEIGENQPEPSLLP